MTKTAFEHNGKTYSAELVDRTHGSFFEITDDRGEYVQGIASDERDVRAAITYFKERRDQLNVARAMTAKAYGLSLQTGRKGAE